ncbi:hypothetical protein FB451DRAFT_283862 [Mycena latifolia]|nr:hypothetical protein FB451DRAFT_283862 [Mycena latifolia]
MRVLFPELVDLMIDHLSSDKAALKACGLVCKQWFPRTRLHLFSEVQLQVGDGWVANEFMVDTVQTFFQLVDTSSFEILPHLRRLSVCYGDPQSLAKADLLRIVQCIRLTHLRIDRPFESEDVDDSLNTQLELLSPSLSSLTEFTFTCFYSSLSETLTLIACLPTVETLCLYVDDLESGFQGSDPLGGLPPHLHTLEMGVLRGVELFFTHVLSLPVLPVLRSLRLDNDTMELHVGTSIATYLERAGPAIQSLTLATWSDAAPFQELAIRCCTDLQHLCISSYHRGHPSTFIADLVSAVSSSELQTVVVKLDELNPQFAWAPVDRVLADSRFRSLRSFSVLSLDRSCITPADLPMASVRGILLQ